MNQVFELKNQLLNKVIRYFEWPVGQLLMSLLLGDAELLPNTMRHSFKIIGIQHIVAASGYNVNLILGMFSWLISRFWPLHRLVLSSLVVGIYVTLAGSSPSLLRAAAQTILVLAVSELGHRPVQLWWLGLVVAVGLSLWQPSLLTAIGFQLSCLSALTMSAIQEVMLPASWQSTQMLTTSMYLQTHHRWWVDFKTKLQSELLMGLSVQLTTGSLIWWYFQEWSWLSLPANLLLGWLTAYLTIGALLSFLAVMVIDFLPILGPIWWIWIVSLNQLGQFFWQTSAWLAQFELFFWTLPPLSGETLGLWSVSLVALSIGRRWCRLRQLDRFILARSSYW